MTAANVNVGKCLDAVLRAIAVKRPCPPQRRSKQPCSDVRYCSAENLGIIDRDGYIVHVVDRR